MAALILFHGLAVRMGIATGRGLVAVIRYRYGRWPGWLSAGFLVVANLGTTAAELAGIAAGLQIAGVPLNVSVPVAAVTVSALIVAGSFHRVEHVLLVLSAIFVTYIASGLLAHPHWGDVGKGLVIPNLPSDRHAVLVATATLGTTLAPWGLAFIQSYAVDKKIPRAPLVPILFLTQALNAVLLLPLLAMIIHLCRDATLMGALRIGHIATPLAWAAFGLIAAAVVALGVYSVP